jgi:hypothetical protein
MPLFIPGSRGSYAYYIYYTIIQELGKAGLTSSAGRRGGFSVAMARSVERCCLPVPGDLAGLLPIIRVAGS